MYFFVQETIVNYGTIIGDISFGFGTGNYLFNGASGEMGSVYAYHGGSFIFVNYGISGALLLQGTSIYAENFGTINGNLTIGGTSDVVYNAGRINGSVSLLSDLSHAYFDSSHGTIYSTANPNVAPPGWIMPDGASAIFAGNGGATIVGALNGGFIHGAAGDDMLYANQTQEAAVLYHGTTSIDGGGGTNAFYGGGAYNEFVSGKDIYNQLWGGLSQMAGVEGYANNIVSYKDAAAGVYVDLLNGHNAYIGSATGSGWTGSGRLEDSISNVPNVFGSAFVDVIQADNGVGGITGYTGADQLYAGSGPASQDTFIYIGQGDSNLLTGYDTIVGFKLGIDKIDLTAFHTDSTHVVISTAGTSNAVYWEKTEGAFNAATDLAISITTTTVGGLHMSDFLL